MARLDYEKARKREQGQQGKHHKQTPIRTNLQGQADYLRGKHTENGRRRRKWRQWDKMIANATARMKAQTVSSDNVVS